MVNTELLVGARNACVLDRLLESLQALDEVPLTPKVGEGAARLGHKLRLKGFSVPLPDLLIAQAAACRSCRVVACRCVLQLGWGGIPAEGTVVSGAARTLISVTSCCAGGWAGVGSPSPVQPRRGLERAPDPADGRRGRGELPAPDGGP